MTALLISAIALASLLLVLVTFVQLLYLESLRLRARERPALEFFKETLAGRLRLDLEQGVLAFSLIKHALLVLLGVLFLGVAIDGGAHPLRSLGGAFLGALFAMLAAAYIAPHLLYRKTRAAWLAPLLPVLRALALAARPFVYMFEFLQSLVELGDQEPQAPEAASPAENIDVLLSAGAEEGLIEESDRELIQSVVAFGDKTVREVMTPRPNIVAIQAERSLEDLRELVINEQYSRIPVYEDSIDEILGFVHVRDMFELEEEERGRRPVRELVRPIRFVPETKPVNDVLREMQQDRAHMAIVIDEYGNTAGLATLEDLLEEVFGEIRDEHEPGLDIAAEDGGAYVVSGNLDLGRLTELLEFRPQEAPESTTVGGLVTEWLGRVPQAGEAVQRDGIRIEVLAANELRVEQVRVSRAKAANHV
ncbi:MAG: hemolysin family protein [Acidobacteriota bacterium]